MNLEPLRELERVAQEMRERRVNHGKSVSPTLIAWADRITAIIAALGEGQEVAPVAWLIRDRKTKVVWMDENSHFGSESEATICAMDMNEEIDDADFEAFAVYASPAHTSDARDAARYRWLRENCGYAGSGPHNGAQVIVYYADVGKGKHGIAYTGPRQRVGIMALDDAIDAAMRQEAE